MSLLTRKRVVAAKIETTIGEAIAVAAADATFNVFDAVIQPNIETIERTQNDASPIPDEVGPHGGQITFSLELIAGSTAPVWASTFLPACGMVATGAVYKPLLEFPGTNVKTLTIGMYQDGRYKQLRGAMGNVVFVMTHGRPVRGEFTFTGIWDEPEDETILAPTYVSTRPVRFANATLLIDAVVPIVQEIRIDLGNDVILRPDGNDDSSGYASACITNRMPKITMNPEANLVATYDPHADWLAQTLRAIQVRMTDGTNKLWFDAPKAQVVNVQEGDRDGLMIDEVEFKLLRTATSADDRLSITFGSAS